MSIQKEIKSLVYFISLGCPKNLVDSQVMLGLLEKGKYQITKTPETAEVIIVNTCSFIQASKEESIDTILEMAELKETGKCKALVVAGCLSQRYSKELEKEMPEVDLFIGTGQYHRITEFLNKHEKSIKLGDPLPNRSYVDIPAFIHSEEDPRLLTGPKFSGYLKLSEGCNRRCAFCIIPKLRGNVRSRSINSLLKEATYMANNGVKELNLVAQDLTHYGIENKYSENLTQLLPELCKIDGIDWIRLHYVYPDDFSDELIDIIANEPKIVKYLDMPIQHTNDRVLKSMGRRLTNERLFKLIEKLRKKIPNIAFRTSIIVGFPGETETEFEQLCSDLKQLDLDHVGVFRFSKEEGTRAEKMTDQIPAQTRKRRQKILNEVLVSQSLQKKEQYINKEMWTLVEGYSEESDLLIQARLSTQAQEIDGHVLINDLEEGLEFQQGDFLKVKVTDVIPQGFLAKAFKKESHLCH